MTQKERLEWLVAYLLRENPRYRDVEIPDGERELKTLFRSLENVRPPEDISEEFLRVQDAYLSEERERKGVVRPGDLTPVQKGVYLWKGDITTLAADAVVNAANGALLGCFAPCHGCIDNAIHSAAGVQLRLACRDLTAGRGAEEPPGRARITPGFNLPCRYVLHTVGPVVYGKVTQQNRKDLASCYRACLERAFSEGLQTVAFCCISTGEFRFPNREAAQIALDTALPFLESVGGGMEVIFNVFKDVDYEIYRELLGMGHGIRERR